MYLTDFTTSFDRLRFYFEGQVYGISIFRVSTLTVDVSVGSVFADYVKHVNAPAVCSSNSLHQMAVDNTPTVRPKQVSSQKQDWTLIFTSAYSLTTCALFL